MLGCIKLVYNNWRLRKYTKIAADKKAIRREMQHSASVRRGRLKDVPFGVRALERGVEVEGVWNSTVNTPVPSVPSSPTLSGSTTKGKSPLDPSSKRPSTATSAVSALSQSEPPQASMQGSPSLASESQPRGRLPYRPPHQPRRSSGLRFSSSHDDAGRAATLAALDVHPVSRYSHGEYHTSSTSSSSSASTPNRDTRRLYEPVSLQDNDGLLHPTYSGYIPSPNSSQASEETNPLQTPSEPRHSLEESLPLSHFDKLASMEAATEPTTRHAQLFDDGDVAYDIGHAQPLQLSDGNMPGRHSQVIRKVNSGFEILRPGSLDAPRQITNSWEEANLKEKRSPRKLQKKDRRQSVASAKIRA